MPHVLIALIANTPVLALPAVLQGLPLQTRHQLSTTLAQERDLGDKVILKFWTAKCDIAPRIAAEAIKFRGYYRQYPLFDLFRELRT